jgi:murein DD-endopeptidase MepM/ murein hydrolase activator NlpD
LEGNSLGRKYYKKSNRKGYKIIIQILFCIIIVVVVISIKKADMTMTNKLLSIVETSLTKEYNFKEIPSNTVGALKKIPELPLKVAKLIQGKNEQLAFSPPVDEGQVISTFGSSYDSIIGTESFQRGIDYYSPKNMDIYSIGDGIVTETGHSNVYGNYIKIHHGQQIFSIYGGCSSIYVNSAQNIKKGDILASVDSSGDDPNYFHFELWMNGEIVNPEEYMDLN